MEIKFRGKRFSGNGKRWVYGKLVENESDIYRCFIVESARWEVDEDGDIDLMETDVYEVIPETVGQFTGLKDKNGVEVYEGDVVKTEHEASGIVTWDNDEARYVFDCREPLWSHPSHGMEGKKEVIGNIHENPELLEV